MSQTLVLDHEDASMSSASDHKDASISSTEADDELVELPRPMRVAANYPSAVFHTLAWRLIADKLDLDPEAEHPLEREIEAAVSQWGALVVVAAAYVVRVFISESMDVVDLLHRALRYAVRRLRLATEPTKVDRDFAAYSDLTPCAAATVLTIAQRAAATRFVPVRKRRDESRARFSMRTALAAINVCCALNRHGSLARVASMLRTFHMQQMSFVRQQPAYNDAVQLWMSLQTATSPVLEASSDVSGRGSPFSCTASSVNSSTEQ